ncbi:MAG: glycerophosphodiester phosphodiesterase [Chlorobiaceae bacterium]|nr:glycerophosphodiester phosphodiesterase [Chlorobiaceae bacterium]
MTFEIQAHRGARSFFPENTIQAFCKAADLGITVIELDLVVSKDLEILVSHDPWLSGPLCSDPDGNPLGEEDRTRFVIYDMPYSEIISFDCGRPHPAFPGQQKIVSSKPLLSDVFRQVDDYMKQSGLTGKMIFNLEIKSLPQYDGLYHPAPLEFAMLVVRLVEDAGFQERVRIQSFDYRVVRDAWKLTSGLCYGVLISDQSNIAPFLQELGFVPHYLNPHHTLVDRKMVDGLHALGIKVIPWTVNREEDMLAMNRIGTDGFITDYPEKALTLFGES